MAITKEYIDEALSTAMHAMRAVQRGEHLINENLIRENQKHC
jgi:hypothetical protein